MRQEFRVESLHEPVSHYTDAVRWGDLLFVSGVSPLNADMSVVSDDISEQARKVFENMAEVLAAAGASFSDVLKINVFLKDVNDRSKVNEVRKKVFGSCRPASTLVGIAAFTIPGMLIEVEAVVGLRS
ncbi:RidA family protein [Bradyrhizobium canariense]|uniref:RidA family protein n=1 Tax=Bradyrhizobium canariense TaxID=255045 RepID=UPI001CA4F23B|nr:RidA family protein [Bradyrhizobium canariense]MBW5435725.1 RidA family protein [Bradyrhizobium canariense]